MISSASLSAFSFRNTLRSLRSTPCCLLHSREKYSMSRPTAMDRCICHRLWYVGVTAGTCSSQSRSEYRLGHGHLTVDKRGRLIFLQIFQDFANSASTQRPRRQYKTYVLKVRRQVAQKNSAFLILKENIQNQMGKNYLKKNSF